MSTAHEFPDGAAQLAVDIPSQSPRAILNRKPRWSQCPFTDGLASALALGPTESLKVLPSVARDLASMAFRRPPAMIPLAGPPGSLALMSAPDALPGYQALLPPNTTFRNEVAARVADHREESARASARKA